MGGVVLQEARSVDSIRYDVKGGRIGCEALALAEVATVCLGHADEGIHAAGVATKHFIHSNTRYTLQTHYGVVREHGVDAQKLHFSNRRVKHHTCTLVVMDDMDLLAEKNLHMKNESSVGHHVDRGSNSKRRDRSFPSPCFREEGSKRAAHLRMCGFQGIDPRTVLLQSPRHQQQSSR